MTRTSSFPIQLELDRKVAVELKDRVDLLNRYFQSVYSDRTPNYVKIEGKENADPEESTTSASRRRENKKL